MNLEILDVAKLGTAVGLWIIVAVVIEEVFKPVFDWKPYRENLDGKGLKIPIVFIGSVLVVSYFNVDIFVALIGSVGVQGDSNWVSKGVSALLLTGGSGTVFRVLNRLREAKKQI